MQHFKRSAEKQRLFNDINAGRVRFVLGSTQTMGTGVNAQLRLKALHHLDVPWLPSDIEQREGRIERQGNQHDEIEIYAYATLGSMDATMWQNNERKARFIAAALSGDRTIRTIDDIGDAANQFALAKAIASGDAQADAEGRAGRRDRPPRPPACGALRRPARRPPPSRQHGVRPAGCPPPGRAESARTCASRTSTRADALRLHWGRIGGSRNAGLPAHCCFPRCGCWHCCQGRRPSWTWAPSAALRSTCSAGPTWRRDRIEAVLVHAPDRPRPAHPGRATT